MKKAIEILAIIVVTLLLVIGLAALAIFRPALGLKEQLLPAGIPVEVAQKGLQKNAIRQVLPEASVKVIGGAEPAPSPLEVSRLRINLLVDAHYEERSERELKSSNIDFKGDFSIRNPLKQEAELTFSMPFPTEGGMVYGVELLVGGKEPEGVSYNQSQVTWTSKFLPQEEKTVTANYKTKAVRNYLFQLPRDKRINDLSVETEIRGAKKVEYPTTVLTPSSKKKLANGWLLKWNFNKVVTSYDVGFELPLNQPTLINLDRVLYASPFFLVIFLLTLVSGAGFVRPDKEVKGHQMLLSIFAFFLFYLLVWILADFLDPLLAFAIPFGIILFLITFYLVFSNGAKFGLLFGGFPVLILLGFFSFALSLPKYTAVLIVAGLLVLVAVAMVASLTKGGTKEKSEEEIKGKA